MTFSAAIRTVFGKYATFSGRARRSEYWWWALFATLAQVALYAMALIILVATSNDDGGTLPGLLGWIPLIVVSLGLALPSLAVAVRRLHDTSRSGWWLLIGAIPFINIVTAIVLLVFYLQDSTPGPNRHGPNPKGVDEPAPAGDGPETTGRLVRRAIGVLGLAAAAVFAVLAIVGGAPLFTTDIADEARYTVVSPGTVEVEPGPYKLWFESEEERPTVEGVERAREETRLRVTTQAGQPIQLEPVDAGDNFTTFVSYGTIEVDTAGELRLDSDRETQVFLTEPLSSTEPFGRLIRWALAAIVAGGLGVVLLATSFRRPTAPPGHPHLATSTNQPAH